MKTSSAKSKGRRLQQLMKETILQKFTELEADDIQSIPSGVAGVDLHLSPRAKQKFPYSIECKNQERVQIWAALQQAEQNTKEGTAPLLVFSRNRTPEPFVALKLSDFMKLVGDKL